MPAPFFETPVLLCTFNRPQQTQRVFEAIARCQPKHLLISSDGPRAHINGEIELVERTRAIIGQVNWPCDIRTRYSNHNHGCRIQMAESINWAFEQFEELIILEDDCLPDDSFFPFCAELLNRFAGDPRVMMISGDNFQPQPRSVFSYYFSKYSHIWGWATWRRAWKYFDLEMRTWPENRNQAWLNRWSTNQAERNYWCDVFDRQHQGQIDTWDYSWAYACWANNGWTILPELNLVSNIGFGSQATHTCDVESSLANLPLQTIKRIQHPPIVARDTVADDFTWNTVFNPKTSSGNSDLQKHSLSTADRAA